MHHFYAVVHLSATTHELQDCFHRVAMLILLKKSIIVEIQLKKSCELSKSIQTPIEISQNNLVLEFNSRSLFLFLCLCLSLYQIYAVVELQICEDMPRLIC